MRQVSRQCCVNWALAIPLLICAASAAAQPGTLDASFGGTGKVAYLPWGPNAQGYFVGMEPSLVEEQSDGKILVGGNTGFAEGIAPRSAVIGRYLGTGATDSFFGSNGYAVVRVADVGGYTVLAGMVPVSGGRILAVVQLSSGSGSTGIFLYRLLSNGTPDPSFGVNGFKDITYSQPGQGHDCRNEIVRVRRAPDGSIYALCVFSGAVGVQVSNWLLKFDEDGVVDSSFGHLGTAPFPAHPCQPRLKDFIVVSDGGFAATGTNAFCQGVYWMRLKANGTLYPFLNGWGLAGASRFPGWVLENGQRIVETTDGKFVIVGDAGTGHAGGFAENPKAPYWIQVTRFLPDGTLDPAFGSSGRTQHASPATADAAFTSVNYGFPASLGLHRQVDGKFVFAVSTFRLSSPGAFTNPAYNVLVIRLLENGFRDPGYGVDGRWYERLNLNANPLGTGAGYENGYASVLDSKGRLVVAGQAQYSVDLNLAFRTEVPMFLMRLSGDPDLPCAEFDDVSSNSAFCANVDWMKNRMITLGCGGPQYCPAQPVNRLAMAAFLNRFGSALAPDSSELTEDIRPSLDLDANVRICVTQLFASKDYPRQARIDATVAATADMPVTFGVRVVRSDDDGATWQAISTSQRGSTSGLHWSNQRIVARTDVEAAMHTRFALALDRDGVAGTVDLAGMRCALRARVENRNGALAPH